MVKNQGKRKTLQSRKKKDASRLFFNQEKRKMHLEKSFVIV